MEKGKEQEILIKLSFLPWNDDNNKYIQHQVFIITGKLDLRGSISTPRNRRVPSQSTYNERARIVY